jgi:hypothetical protein
VQQICPADVSDHLAMGTYDPVAYALVIDAFTHSATADPSRIPISVCAEPFQPGVDPATFPSDYASFLAAIGQAYEQSPEVSAEPPLRCYVFDSCRPSARRAARPRVRRAAHRRASHRRRAAHHSHRR